jgi:hypothetical protein
MNRITDSAIDTLVVEHLEANEKSPEDKSSRPFFMLVVSTALVLRCMNVFHFESKIFHDLSKI